MNRSAPSWLLAASAIALLFAPSTASAQLDQLELRAEGGAAVMLPDYQRDTLGFDWGGEVAFRPGFRLFDFLTPQLAIGAAWFPAGSVTGQAFFAGGGLRAEPRIFDAGRIFVDADVLYTRTGPDDRFGFDVGAGLEFDVASIVSLGPYVRYHHVVASGVAQPTDASYLSFGASLVVRAGEAPVPPSPEPPAPEPAEVEEDRDSDRDGVQIPTDLCPETPQGEHPDPRRPGCPEGDRDGDGILDSMDDCPDEPGEANPGSGRHGCPAVTLVEEPDGTGVLQLNRPIYFETNSDVLQARSTGILTDVATSLRQHASLSIRVEGHADDRGTAEHNFDLSRRRARRVREWLVAHGIEASRLTSEGYGETRHVVEANTPDAHARNRRVEFRVITHTQETP